MNTWTRTGVAVFAAAAALTAFAPPAQADTYGEFYAAVDWLGKKYGVLVYVDSAPMEYGTYAQTTGSRIVLNSGYEDNPGLLDASMASDVQSGYHRGELCTAPQLLAAHEFAHALDNITGHAARTRLSYALASGMNGVVSGYATESVPEAIAEGFAAVECSAAPTPAERAIYAMLVN